MEQRLDIFLEPLRGFLTELGMFLPKLIGAIVVLVAGWLVAKVFYFLVVRGLKTVRFNVVTEMAGLDDFLKKGSVRKSTIEVLGLLVYWLFILFVLLAAFNV